MAFSPAFYRFGLIGYPLHHSLSPVMHEAALRAVGLRGRYVLFTVPPSRAENALPALLTALRQGRLHGLNVTLPYKTRLFPWLDVLTTTAQHCAAVNTIYVKHGRLVGENTDAPAFWEDAHTHLPLKTAPRWRMVILGAGGAARAAAYMGLRAGWPVHVLARTLDKAKALAQALKPLGTVHVHPWSACTNPTMPWFQGDLPVLLVNATPVGMHPHTEVTPWPASGPWPRPAAVYDMVYNPATTWLVRAARAAGLPAVTGLGMLARQGARAFALWTGISAEQVRPVMEKALRAALGDDLEAS